MYMFKDRETLKLYNVLLLSVICAQVDVLRAMQYIRFPEQCFKASVSVLTLHKALAFLL